MAVLLARGANPKAKLRFGDGHAETPLHVAVVGGHLACAQPLLAAGAEL
jgi:hypothetical protein